MSNRKATFAKRQREMDLKDKARAKEAARAERQSQPKAGKGPQIDWSDENYIATQQASAQQPDDGAPPQQQQQPPPQAAPASNGGQADSNDE